MIAAPKRGFVYGNNPIDSRHAERTHGYIQRQLFQAIGFYHNTNRGRLRRILAETAPKALIMLDNSERPVVQTKQGGTANFAPAGILTEIVTGVIDAALDISVCL